MEIKVERLIGVVQEHFDNEQSYVLNCKKKDWWKRTHQEDKDILWHERNRQGTSNEVRDLCEILNLDMRNLYSIARLARNWERKRDWQLSFPVQGHEQQILKYLEKTNSFEGSFITYIHRNINRKAEEAAQPAA